MYTFVLHNSYTLEDRLNENLIHSTHVSHPVEIFFSSLKPSHQELFPTSSPPQYAQIFEKCNRVNRQAHLLGVKIANRFGDLVMSLGNAPDRIDRHYLILGISGCAVVYIENETETFTKEYLALWCYRSMKFSSIADTTTNDVAKSLLGISPIILVSRCCAFRAAAR